MKNNFVVNFTFYAGSNDTEDTDKKSVIFTINSNEPVNLNNAITKFENLSKTANAMLDPFNYEDDNKNIIGFTYEEGININTLIKAMNILGKKDNMSITDAQNFSGMIMGVFDAEQWQ